MSKETKEQTLRAVDSSLDEEWAKECLEKLRKIALYQRWVTIDDLWAVIDAPDGDQAKVGAIMRRAAGTNHGGKLIKRTPYRVYSTRGHHDNVMLWESTVWLKEGKMPDIAAIVAIPELDVDLTKLANVYQAAVDWKSTGYDVDQVDIIKEVLDPTA
jgi:hypothetical protein